MNKFMTVCMLFVLSTISIFAQTQPRKWVLPSAFPNASSTSSSETGAKKQSVFATKEEASAAYASGNFTFYVPTHLGMTEKRPVDGVKTKAFALERDTLALLLVFGNRFAWVVLQEGTVCRYELASNGQPQATPYAHHACGNPIKAVAYPAAKVVQPVASAPAPVAAQPVTVQAPAPQVFVQVPSPQVTVVPAPPTYITAPAPQVIVQQQPVDRSYGPTRPSILPSSRVYDAKPNFQEPMPARPEVKKLHWGWKVLGGAILGFAVYKALDHKKPEPQRSVVTDPPTGAAQSGGFAIHF